MLALFLKEVLGICSSYKICLFKLETIPGLSFDCVLVVQICLIGNTIYILIMSLIKKVIRASAILLKFLSSISVLF